MTFSEHQIRRYSRQLLLKQVGGRGQEKLLATGLRVAGPTEAVEVALAYLAAGGTPLDAAGAHGGFFAGWQVDAINPDASGLARSLIYLCIGADEVSLARCADCALVESDTRNTSVQPELVEGARVQLRDTQDDKGVALRQAQRERNGVVLGAFAALCAQRAVLELDPIPVRWRLDPDGSFSPLPALLCKSHAT